MTSVKLSRLVFLMGGLVAILKPVPGLAQQSAEASATNPQPAARDGQHDFDFAIGTWTIHLKRRLNPLTGSDKWVELDGTLVSRKVWDGRANLEELEMTDPTTPIEGLALRLYNSQTHQWSIYWANSKNGSMDPSPQIGQFQNGRGEFYGWDTLNGKFIYVRFVWTNTDSASPHFEQSFSNDGGKTWELNWISDQTRVKGKADRVRAVVRLHNPTAI